MWYPLTLQVEPKANFVCQQKCKLKSIVYMCLTLLCAFLIANYCLLDIYRLPLYEYAND